MKTSSSWSSLLALSLACGLAEPVLAQTNTFPDSGNVGIGTMSPGYGVLDVYQSAARSNAAMIEVNNADTLPGYTYGIWLKNRNATNGNYTSIVNWDAAHDGNAWIDFINVDQAAPKGAIAFSTRNGASWSRKMLIDENGNVGVGTVSPVAKLEVKGDHYNSRIRIFSDHYGQGIDGGNTANLNLWASEPGWTWGGAGIGNNASGGSSGVVRVTNTRGGSYLRLLDDVVYLNTIDSAGTDRNGITVSNGSVGVGIGSPGYKLHVAGETFAAGFRVAGLNGDNVAGTPWYGLGFASGGLSLAQGSTSVVQLAGFYGLNFRTGGGQMVIRGDTGNVGIGTTNPTNKLEVNGTIRTKEVIVETTGWSDYVFAPDYRLAPLSEVEAHIQSKGTLPGIPSAAEVAEHGVSIGDMQAKLLAKMEELTLHVIALSKEVESLKAENAMLRTK